MECVYKNTFHLQSKNKNTQKHHQKPKQNLNQGQNQNQNQNQNKNQKHNQKQSQQCEKEKESHKPNPNQLKKRLESPKQQQQQLPQQQPQLPQQQPQLPQQLPPELQPQQQQQFEPQAQFQLQENPYMSKKLVGLSHTFWTIEELQQALPQIVQLKEVFNLFLTRQESNAIETGKVGECVRAMGLHFLESSFQRCLRKRLENFPQNRQPTRVSFELVLSIYCELAAKHENPSVDIMINGLGSCDIDKTGVLPYSMLKRMLTSMGERLNENEVCDLLDSLKDKKGNVDYVTLMETVFKGDLCTEDKLGQVQFYLDALGKNACYMDMRKRDDFIKALRSLDAVRSGYIASSLLLQLLNSSEERFTASELITLTKGMTKNKTHIDYRRFLRLIMNE